MSSNNFAKNCDKIIFIIFNATVMIYLPARASEQGNVIGSVRILLGERSEPHTGVFNRDFA